VDLLPAVLLPDEDPEKFAAHAVTWLTAWAPRDLHEHEATVLTDLFAAGEITDHAERQAAKPRPSRR
jgi:hypothetical protein